MKLKKMKFDEKTNKENFYKTDILLFVTSMKFLSGFGLD